jgi:hypothetical protein
VAITKFACAKEKDTQKLVKIPRFNTPRFKFKTTSEYKTLSLKMVLNVEIISYICNI